jgi:hypothetical protein
MTGIRRGRTDSKRIKAEFFSPTGNTRTTVGLSPVESHSVKLPLPVVSTEEISGTVRVNIACDVIEILSLKVSKLAGSFIVRRVIATS